MQITKTEVKGASNTYEAMQQADLDYTTAPVEICTTSGIMAKNHRAILREDNNEILGIVGNRYHPVQNHEAFALGDTLLEEYGIQYENGYCVDEGRQAMLQAKLPQSFEVTEGDRIDEYLTIVNSHDGSKPVTVLITPVRLWCMNQLNSAIQSASNSVKIRHTVTALNRAKIAMSVFTEAQDYFQKFEIKAKELSQKLMDKRTVEAFLDSLVGPVYDKKNGKKSTRKENIRRDIVGLYGHGKGNSGKTAWDMYNGVTEYVDHHRGSDDEKRLASSMVGSGVTMKEQAWSLLNKI